MIAERLKQRVIDFIDDTIQRKIRKEQVKKLNNLRDKYIFKDISTKEVIEDIKYILIIENIKGQD
jgi:hypothetical protein